MPEPEVAGAVMLLPAEPEGGKHRAAQFINPQAARDGHRASEIGGRTSGRGFHRMASIWVESLGRSFEQSFGLLEAAIGDFTDDLWESSMWEVGDGDAAYAARRSTPWSVAWHALEIVDYDLTGDLTPFSPPPPFTDKATGATSRSCRARGRSPNSSHTSTSFAGG